jgi:hypothetical protein
MIPFALMSLSRVAVFLEPRLIFGCAVDGMKRHSRRACQHTHLSTHAFVCARIRPRTHLSSYVFVGARIRPRAFPARIPGAHSRRASPARIPGGTAQLLAGMYHYGLQNVDFGSQF